MAAGTACEQAGGAAVAGPALQLTVGVLVLLLHHQVVVQVLHQPRSLVVRQQLAALESVQRTLFRRLLRILGRYRFGRLAVLDLLLDNGFRLIGVGVQLGLEGERLLLDLLLGGGLSHESLQPLLDILARFKGLLEVFDLRSIVGRIVDVDNLIENHLEE